MLKELEKNKVEVEGIVDRIVFQNPENEYTVIAIKPESGKSEYTVVGKMIGIAEGENIKVIGKWKNSIKFGKQIEAESFHIVVPATTVGLEKFLASGLIRGIGKQYAKRIVKHFSLDTIKVLDDEPDKLKNVDGIGEKRLQIIKEAWDKHRSISEIMMALQSYGISTAWAIRIYKFYKEQSVTVLKSNPYQIALDIQGIGFKTADKIAEKLGIPKDSPYRAEAGLLHVLSEFSEEGNTYCPYTTLAERAESLQIPRQNINPALLSINQKDKVKLETLKDGTKAVYTTALFYCENNAAENLKSIINHPKLFPVFDFAKAIESFEKKHNIEFAPEQKEALEMVFKGQVSVITGGPGTGKTTIVKAIIEILEKHNVRISLASPTGRAAKRLSETTNRNAATIHRLLKYKPETGKFFYNDYNKLTMDLLIIDETSMLDIILAHNLIKAVEPTSSIVFVGDIDQLPSVGPGNFLKDIINSGKVSVTRLKKIFRQAQRSLIILNAHKINEGSFPYIHTDKTGKMKQDFFFIEKDNPEEALAVIKELIKERIPRKFSLHPVDDIQIISPMYKGVLGVHNLNHEIQNLLNTDKNELVRGFLSIRVGDKVIQNKNNYDKDVFNGDIGIVRSINRIDLSVKISFYDKTVIYEYDDLDELSLAYAVSVHKSQGSEYPAIIIPVHTQHFIMLQRNLLYTGVTRGKKIVCVVGTKKALAIAIKNDKTKMRYSGLVFRLQAENNDLLKL